MGRRRVDGSAARRSGFVGAVAGPAPANFHTARYRGRNSLYRNRRRDQDWRRASGFPPHQRRRLEFRAVEHAGPCRPRIASRYGASIHARIGNRRAGLDPGDYQTTNFAEFGLDPPAYLVSLEKADRSEIVADFGTLNPSGTAQYLRLVGQPNVYLMPRHVGTEWEVTADMARRTLPPEAGSSDDNAKRLTALLLPASIDRVWAIEIVGIQGKLHRLERDGAGNWLLHTGQHAHAGSSDVHIADLDKAPIIRDSAWRRSTRPRSKRSSRNSRARRSSNNTA